MWSFRGSLTHIMGCSVMLGPHGAVDFVYTATVGVAMRRGLRGQNDPLGFGWIGLCGTYGKLEGNVWFGGDPGRKLRERGWLGFG